METISKLLWMKTLYFALSPRNAKRYTVVLCQVLKVHKWNTKSQIKSCRPKHSCVPFTHFESYLSKLIFHCAKTTAPPKGFQHCGCTEFPVNHIKIILKHIQIFYPFYSLSQQHTLKLQSRLLHIVFWKNSHSILFWKKSHSIVVEKIVIV